MESRNVIVEKTIEFSVAIISFVEELNRHRKYVIANQLLRAGTAIGANVFEAQQAESRSDFIHKMKLAIKEANETHYWLILCDRSEGYPHCSSLKGFVEDIIRIISKIISSSKSNSQRH